MNSKTCSLIILFYQLFDYQIQKKMIFALCFSVNIRLYGRNNRAKAKQTNTFWIFYAFSLILRSFFASNISLNSI